MAEPNLTNDKDNNTMMPIYLTHETKLKEGLNPTSPMVRIAKIW